VGVPEVFKWTYDVQKLLDASSRLRDRLGMRIPMLDILRKRRTAGELELSEFAQLTKEFRLVAVPA